MNATCTNLKASVDRPARLMYGIDSTSAARQNEVRAKRHVERRVERREERRKLEHEASNSPG